MHDRAERSMIRRGVIPRALALLVVSAAWLAIPGVARAQGYALPSADSYYRLDWTAGQNKKGVPVISGYVYDTSGRTTDSMRLAIDTLDASGNVTGTTVGYVNGTIAPSSRAYFEIRVPAASAYRVRVLWFRWLQIGGGP